MTFVITVTSCTGQATPESRNESPGLHGKTVVEYPKIPKPKGIYKDATIGCGIQDKSGNFWFGSNGEGIYRYDGKSFVNFTEKDGLDNNIVYSILEDQKGNIWVGTKNGLNRYTPSADKTTGITFTSVPILLSNAGLYSLNRSSEPNPSHQNAVWSMMQDKSGTIWFGTDDGVYCYNGYNFSSFLNNYNVVNRDSLKLKSIFSILQDKTGNIWFTECTGEGVSRFDGRFLTNIIPYKDIGRTDQVIEDRNGNLWFCAVFKGLCRYDGKTFTKNVFNEKANCGPFSVLEDNTGNIWFYTQEGPGYYDGKNLNILTEKDGLPDKNLSPVLKDKSGNIWFRGKCMSLFQYNGTRFTNFSE